MDEAERTLLGAQFDLDAQGYDEGRPDYPAEAWEIVLRHLDVGPGDRVVEVGPGTGQATGRLLGTGAEVHAVEPGGDLSALLRRRFSTTRLTVQTSGLETADLVPGTADAVASATAFHWVDPDLGIPVLRRVLKPGGRLCLWWNVYRDPASQSVDPVDAFVRRSTRLPNTRGLNGILDELDLPQRLHDAGFVAIEQHTVRWTGTHDETSLVALFASFSDMRKRPAPERDRVLDGLRELVRAEGGTVMRAYTTPILTAGAPS